MAPIVHRHTAVVSILDGAFRRTNEGLAVVWALAHRCVHVHREPGPDGYRVEFTVEFGASVECAALPRVRIEVAELFPA